VVEPSEEEPKKEKVKKRPTSSATDDSEDRFKRRALPCWFEGPVNEADIFKQFTPRSGDLLEVVPLSGGDETAVTMCEVIHADCVDDMGLLAILKFLSSDDEKMTKQAKQVVTGSPNGDVSSLHFLQISEVSRGR